MSLTKVMDPMAGSGASAAKASIAQDHPIGALVYEDGSLANEIMLRCADRLRSCGAKLAGMIQMNNAQNMGQRCQMYLQDLMSGHVVRISEDRGRYASGCRLDLTAFTQATHLCQQSLSSHPDIVFINKFGRQEAQGNGLRAVIAEAAMVSIPLLIGVPRRNLREFQLYISGPVVELALDDDAVLRWCRARTHL